MPPKHQKPTGPSPDNWRAILTKILQRAVSSAAKTEECVDNLACACLELISSKGPHSADFKGSHQRPRGRDAPTEQQRILQAEARAGVNSVQIVLQPDGSAIVHIDGRSGVPLSPRLGQLMAILIPDSGVSPDHLIGWKSVTDITFALAKRTGGKFNKHNISALICRLREQLARHDNNRFLVQHHPQLGYRFALKRGHSSVTEGNHR